jgi:hypothetical protein
MTPEDKKQFHHFLEAIVIRNPEADKPLEGAFDKDGKQLSLREAVEQNLVPDRVYESLKDYLKKIVDEAEKSMAKGGRLYTLEEVNEELRNRKPKNRPKP